MPNRIQRKFIIDALDNQELLTEWEIDFINSIADKKDHEELTEKQNAVLNRISQKINRES